MRKISCSDLSVHQLHEITARVAWDEIESDYDGYILRGRKSAGDCISYYENSAKQTKIKWREGERRGEILVKKLQVGSQNDLRWFFYQTGKTIACNATMPGIHFSTIPLRAIRQANNGSNDYIKVNN